MFSPNNGEQQVQIHTSPKQLHFYGPWLCFEYYLA
jgi:hypothetical protein